MKRLLLDQGIPRSTARILNAAGWDVVHVGDIGDRIEPRAAGQDGPIAASG